MTDGTEAPVAAMAERGAHDEFELSSARARAGTAALALWAQGEGRRLARELNAAQIPALLLKGPELQQRLYGTPAAYPSGDLDILIRPQDALRTRRLLQAQGWDFERQNGVLWRWSSAASYEREGFRLDLHWGVHAAHLPATALRSLAAALWAGAARGPSGFLEPQPEPLLVYLAVHVVGHRFEHRAWSENVLSASKLVNDWPRVWQIADAARVRTAVGVGIGGRPPGTRAVVLDGVYGQAVWWLTWLLRGGFIPETVRTAMRSQLADWREGFGFVGAGTSQQVTFGGLTLEVPRGVFAPKPVTERLLESAAVAIGDVPTPRVIEVGTGSGALGLALARRRPDAAIFATDTSPRAITASRRNRVKQQCPNVHFALGNLLDTAPPAFRGRTDLILANLPYVPRGLGWRVRDWGAPMGTVFGPDSDGLGLQRRLAQQSREFLKPGGLVGFQMIGWQWDGFAAEIARMGFAPLPREDVPLGNGCVGLARFTGAVA